MAEEQQEPLVMNPALERNLNLEAMSAAERVLQEQIEQAKNLDLIIKPVQTAKNLVIGGILNTRNLLARLRATDCRLESIINYDAQQQPNARHDAGLFGVTAGIPEAAVRDIPPPGAEAQRAPYGYERVAMGTMAPPMTHFAAVDHANGGSLFSRQSNPSVPSASGAFGYGSGVVGYGSCGGHGNGAAGSGGGGYGYERPPSTSASSGSESRESGNQRTTSTGSTAATGAVASASKQFLDPRFWTPSRKLILGRLFLANESSYCGGLGFKVAREHVRNQFNLLAREEDHSTTLITDPEVITRELSAMKEHGRRYDMKEVVDYSDEYGMICSLLARSSFEG